MKEKIGVVFLFLMIMSCVVEVQASSRSLITSRLLSEVLMITQLDYVDPKHFLPEKMLSAGIRKAENTIPEVLINTQSLPEGLQIKVSVASFSAQETFPPVKDLSELHRVLQWILSIGEKQLDARGYQRMEYSLIQGALKQLDSHSALLPAFVYEQFRINLRGKFTGIGISVDVRDSQVFITDVVRGSPAEKAGLQEDDQILRIEGESVEEYSLTTLIRKVRGKSGTTIEMEIQREGWQEPKSLVITRDSVEIESIEAITVPRQKTEKKIRYIQMKFFQYSTNEQLMEDLGDIESLDGIILDLRDNQGGLLDQAIEVVDHFLPPDQVIVSTVDSRLPTSTFISRERLENSKLYAIPLIVLVNQSSASASEIVASALKEHRRAIVLGEQTFGKGSIQSFFVLEDGSAMKLTIAKYLTLGKYSIQSVGVTPHIALFPVTLPPQTIQILPELREKTERDLATAFEQEAPPSTNSSYSLSYLVQSPSDDAQLSEELETDYYVTFAEKILNTHTSERTLLDTAIAVYEEEKIQQQTKIFTALEQIKVDWSEASPPKQNLPTEIQMILEEDPVDLLSTDQLWPANNFETLRVKVNNPTQHRIGPIVAVLRSKNPVFNHREFLIGTIDAGKAQSWDIEMIFPRNLGNRLVPVDVELYHRDQKIQTSSHFLRFENVEQPHYALEWKAWDDGTKGSRGNGDLIPQAGERWTISLMIRNIGKGNSEKTTLFLDHKNKNLIIHSIHKSFGILEPQQEVKYNFRLTIQNTIDSFTLDLKLQDQSYSETRTHYSLHLDHLKKRLLPPKILFDPKTAAYSQQVVSTPNIRFSGIIEDDQAAKDYFIFLNQKKMKYAQNPKRSSTFPWQAELKLEEGANDIYVFARDQEKSTTTRWLQVWYDPHLNSESVPKQ